MFTASPQLKLKDCQIRNVVMLDGDGRHYIVGERSVPLKGFVNLHYKGYLAMQASESIPCTLISVVPL